MIKLNGHSGCCLNIISNNNVLVVEKESKDLNYNIRLKNQVEKQKKYSHNVFKSPKVYDEYYKNDIYCFTMEYVQGILLSDKLKSIELSQIQLVSEKFFSLFEINIEYDKNAKYKIYSKLEELVGNIKISNYIFDKSFYLLKNFDWNYLAKGSCHGDLTLENIILRNEEIYLIDFLDSFYDSWMIDCAKLLQDLECHWSYRKEKLSENTEIRLIIFKNLLLSQIEKLANGEQILKTIYHLLLLNLLRIIPYTKDKVTMEFLIRNIEKVIKIIEKS